MPLSVRQLSVWSSLLHACVVLVLIPLALCGPALESCAAFESTKARHEGNAVQQLVAWGAFFRQQLEAQPPTQLMQLICGISGGYYLADLAVMLANIHPLTATVKAWYTVHHVFCFLGLVVPAFFAGLGIGALDCTLALLGFWVGEVSNPPRCAMDVIQLQIDKQHARRVRGEDTLADTDLMQQQLGADQLWLWGLRYSAAQIKSLMQSLQLVHTVMFIAFRFVGVYLVIHWLWPYAQLRCTLVSGIVTMLLSLIAVGAMLQGGVAPPSDSNKQAQRAHTRKQSSSGAAAATATTTTQDGDAHPLAPSVQAIVDASVQKRR